MYTAGALETSVWGGFLHKSVPAFAVSVEGRTSIREVKLLMFRALNDIVIVIEKIDEIDKVDLVNRWHQSLTLFASGYICISSSVRLSARVESARDSIYRHYIKVMVSTIMVTISITITIKFL